MKYAVAALVAVPFVLGDVAVERADLPLPPLRSASVEPPDAEVHPFRDRFGYNLFGLLSADEAPMEEQKPPEQSESLPEGRPRVSTAEFCDALTAAAEANDLPVSFFARLIWQESNFRYEEVSHVGAQGVAQFMPQTAAEVGLDDPFDPLKALPASARLLRRLREQLGNIGLAAAAYNAGAGRIQNWLARRSSLPEETRNYVRRITGNPAENWTSDNRQIQVRNDLPREAPCEGVRGLSRAREHMEVSVSLAPEIRSLLDKVRAAEAAARQRMAEARAEAKARAARRSKSKTTVLASAASGHRAARTAKTEGAERRRTRLASADR